MAIYSVHVLPLKCWPFVISLTNTDTKNIKKIKLFRAFHACIVPWFLIQFFNTSSSSAQINSNDREISKLFFLNYFWKFLRLWFRCVLLNRQRKFTVSWLHFFRIPLTKSQQLCIWTVDKKHLQVSFAFFRSLIMISISHILLVVNSSTNIFIYCFLSSKFRQECAKLYQAFCNKVCCK